MRRHACLKEKLERAMGFEPTTPTLARLVPLFLQISPGFLKVL
jgi:hypothetical protein